MSEELNQTEETQTTVEQEPTVKNKSRRNSGDKKNKTNTDEKQEVPVDSDVQGEKQDGPRDIAFFLSNKDYSDCRGIVTTAELYYNTAEKSKVVMDKSLPGRHRIFAKTIISTLSIRNNKERKKKLGVIYDIIRSKRESGFSDLNYFKFRGPNWKFGETEIEAYDLLFTYILTGRNTSTKPFEKYSVFSGEVLKNLIG
jgi:hypothetical protein